MGLRQDAQIRDINLHIAVGEVLIHRFPGSDGALRHQDVLRPDALGLLAQGLRRLAVEGQLDDAGAVPQVDEHQHPLVPELLHPAADHHLLAGEGGGGFAAVVGALQSCHCVCHASYSLFRCCLKKQGSGYFCDTTSIG